MPSLSGSTQAPLYAQFGKARFGATRFGYTSPKVFVRVNSVQRAEGRSDTTQILQDLSITETNNATPNKATFTVKGTWEPTIGNPVVITLGSANRNRRLFAGSILNVIESNDGQQRVFRVECVDWTWELDNSALVYGKFTGTYDTIATTLMSTYAPTGFTSRHVEAGLPTCTGGITFTGVKLSKALDRLQKRARGEGITVQKFIDYSKDLYFRKTQSIDYTNPQTITSAATTLRVVVKRTDLSQIANRVPCIGGGANALTEVAAGETILPLTDAPDYWYGDTGGTVVSGPQKITYTARVAGGGGSVVGPGVSPSNAPTLALASGTGVDSGAHSVTVVWKTASGRTLPGPSSTITVGTISAPSTAVTAGTPSAGGSMDGGTHRYYPVFRTAGGATTAGPVSNSVTAVSGNAAPTMPVDSAINTGFMWLFSDGPLPEDGSSYVYKIAFRRASDGALTNLSSGSSLSVSIAPDVYTYGALFRHSLITVPSGYSLVFFRQKNGTGSFYECTDMRTFQYNFGGSIETGMWDYTAAGSLGSAGSLSVNSTIKGTCAITDIPVSASPVVTYVDMYREFNNAGASTAKLAFSVANGVTTATDSIANSSLGATVPSSNTATANQIALSGIAVGPSGTTDRELYMSPAGGGTRRLALTIANNTATTGTITMSDATLAGQSAEPGSDTSGLTQPSGQVVPGATSLVVAGTAPFSSGGGWAFTGTQQIRYTGYSGSSLTGIPASGAGAIQQAISYNSTIAAAPCLTGIPASGAGSIQYTIPKGDPVNLIVTVDDTSAQSTLASRLNDGTGGVRECVPLSDNRLSRTEAITRASAFLALRGNQSTTLGPLVTKDVNCRAGVQVAVNISTPHNINATFNVAAVTISNFTESLPPDYTVQASDEWITVEDLLNRDA